MVCQHAAEDMTDSGTIQLNNTRVSFLNPPQTGNKGTV